MRELHLKSGKHLTDRTMWTISKFFACISGLLLCLCVIASRDYSFESTDAALGLKYPLVKTLELPVIEFPPIGPIAPKPALHRLIDTAYDLTGKTYVPYIYGGRRLGEKPICGECTRCLASKNLGLAPISKRAKACQACRKCGIDCSHFVNYVFNRAGLRFKFSDTMALGSKTETELLTKHDLVSIHGELSLANPGDLILEPGHVVIVVAIDRVRERLDYIHATEDVEASPWGGIELSKDVSFTRFYHKPFKILRHVDLIEPVSNKGSFVLVSQFMKHIQRLWIGRS